MLRSGVWAAVGGTRLRGARVAPAAPSASNSHMICGFEYTFANYKFIHKKK